LKINYGGFGWFAAAFSGSLPLQGKSPPLRSGWLLFFSPDCALFALFASFCFFFCFAIVFVCAPHPIFLSFFALFLVACWLSLIPWLQTSGGSIPRLHSSAVLLLGPVPWPRRCSCLIPSLTAAVLLLGPFLGLGGAPARSLPRPRRSSALQPRLNAPPRLLAFASVLRTKPLASPRFSFLAPRPRLGSPPRVQSSVP
jgi:hypothetical protein